MKLYLLRHAEAEDEAQTDAARRLTPRGVEQARAVGRFCASRELRPELVLFSPFVRTVQSANLFAEAWPPETLALQPAPFAASGMHPASAFAELRALERLGCVMIVGHQPDLGLLAASLLGLRETGNLPVGKASLIGLEIRHLTPGNGSLDFLLPVALMA